MPSATASRPAGPLVKRLLVGRAFTSAQLEHTLLPRVLALPVFASDALSSVAYATGEIFIQLSLVSLAFTHLVMPISLAIAALMAIVVISYRQTVRAYPSAAAPTSSARTTSAPRAGLVAGAALLVDYTLDRAVSIVAGGLHGGHHLGDRTAPGSRRGDLGRVARSPHRGQPAWCAKESGRLFAPPTYGYIAVMSIFILYGIGLAPCSATSARSLSTPKPSPSPHTTVRSSAPRRCLR